MTKSTKRLGRGLSSLISGDLGRMSPRTESLRVAAPGPPQEGSSALAASVLPPPGISPYRLVSLPVDDIRHNPMQPRRHFEQGALASLAESIKEFGTLQPIIVRPREGGYELVAGERRLRAARMAGLTEINAIIRSVPDNRLLELALIENVQRADLNPIERAMAYRALHVERGLSQAEIGERVGEDRATVANYIRILDLQEPLQELVAAGHLTVGHAKAILGITDPQTQLELGERAAKEGWSVRRAEKEVSGARETLPGNKSKTRSKRPAVCDMEERLTAAIGSRVTIIEGRKRHTGRLVIEYYTLEDFERILRLLDVDVDSV